MDISPIVAVFQRPAILDSRTRLEDIYLSHLGDGWLIVDRSRHDILTLFIRVPAHNPCTSLSQVREALLKDNKELPRLMDGTHIALAAWLAHQGTMTRVPPVINVEETRQLLVSREPRPESPEKKQKVEHVIVVE